MLVPNTSYLLVLVRQDGSLTPTPTICIAKVKAGCGSQNLDNSTCITSVHQRAKQDIAYVWYVNQCRFYYSPLWCFPLSFTPEQGSTSFGPIWLALVSQESHHGNAMLLVKAKALTECCASSLRDPHLLFACNIEVVLPLLSPTQFIFTIQWTLVITLWNEILTSCVSTLQYHHQDPSNLINNQLRWICCQWVYWL